MFDLLRDAILDGTLVPGERIRDNDLQERFGMSRTPIRLALDRLEELRLVESRPNRHTRVSSSDPLAVPLSLEVMCSLWALAARLSVPGLSTAERRECHRRFEIARSACREGPSANPSGAVEHLRHALFFLSEKSGNPLLITMVVNIGLSLRFQAVLQGHHLDLRSLDTVLRDACRAVDDNDASTVARSLLSIRHLPVLTPPDEGLAVRAS